MRNLTKSGKTLPTIILIIIPSIATVLGLIITVLAPALFERTTPAAGVGFFVVIVYIFYPRSAKYFKKREYQKGIDEFQYIKKSYWSELLSFLLYS